MLRTRKGHDAADSAPLVSERNNDQITSYIVNDLFSIFSAGYHAGGNSVTIAGVCLETVPTLPSYGSMVGVTGFGIGPHCPPGPTVDAARDMSHRLLLLVYRRHSLGVMWIPHGRTLPTTAGDDADTNSRPGACRVVNEPDEASCTLGLCHCDAGRAFPTALKGSVRVVDVLYVHMVLWHFTL
jgi:hypothetical protein